jgi:hypothetical protein
MTRLCLLLASLSAAALVCTSCSSTTPTANAYVTSTLGTNPNDTASTATCNIDVPFNQFLTIGTESTPVADGTSFGGAPIQVECKVHSTGGDSYQVDLDITEGNNGALGGITIDGTLTTSTGVQTGISAAFNLTNTGQYSEKDCTVTLSTETNPAITAGRVWGTVTCPTATYAETGDICYAQATFLFQDCDQ